ncbi:EamA family transporter RarD [Pseudomonas sp. R2.Fl]|nr:EamA family transporter RarD [Pseudomonas sp. R2.Fl]
MASNDAAPTVKNEDTPRGFAFALAAYFLWGFLPLYLKMVAHIAPMEVVAHRVLWSLPISAAVLIVLRRWRDVLTALRTPSMLGMAMLTAALITCNWLIYVYAVTSGHALQAALGYYINPLISVLIGAVLLKERMQALQKVAIGLAVIAVAILTWDAGGLPWISLGLATSWGFYAFFRKTLPVGPNQGFFLEVLILSVPSLAYLVFLETAGGGGHFLHGAGASDMALLAFSGVATAVPLMIYANGAKLLRLSTIGMMQYIAPTMVFLIAVFMFGEPFNATKLVAFLFIWAGLVAYSWPMITDLIRRHKSENN